MNLGFTRKTIRRCFLRSSMLNSVYNARGLQSVGFLYSVLPGLRELYPDDEAFAQSCARYSRHFNCHVIWAPLLCGAFLHAERHIASGLVSPDMIEKFKETTLNSLSAVGDSFVSGSLVVSLMLLLSCLVMLENTQVIWIFLAVLLLLALLLKAVTFFFGLARGFTVLRHIRRLNLINKGDYLKILNGILLAAFLALALGFPPPEAADMSRLRLVLDAWFLPIGVMVLMSYAVARIHLSRSLALVVMVLGTSLLI